MRLIALLRDVQNSSANPFEVNVREKLLVLKKQLPQWKFLGELLLDSEAIHHLVQIVKLQEQWLKHRASSLYIDPLLLELKLHLLSKEELADSLVKSWHPVSQLDQLTSRGLEKAFIYWRELAPASERFREEFGKFGTPPGQIDYDQLIGMNIFSNEQFETRLNAMHKELLDRCGESGSVDYWLFVQAKNYETTVLRAYLVAFLLTEARATLRIDPLTDQMTLFPLSKKPAGEANSVAIEVAKA